MIDIRPEHLSLARLLERRLFKIPDYQRAYSWTSRERNDLFSDIERTFLKGEDEGHYMATIVCLHRDTIRLGTDDYAQLDIVDGQQRLTTLILLLNALRLELDHKNAEQQRGYENLTQLLVKQESDSLLLLQTNHDSSHYFSEFLRKEKTFDPTEGQTLADRELLRAIKDCQNFVKRWLEQDWELLDMYAFIKNQLSFILHVISDEKLVYTVFEVLNSRGMEVSWLDRLKSILMGKAFDLENIDKDQLIDELHTIWRDIYREIGLRQGLSTEALRFAATLFSSTMPHKPLSERDAVDTFRRRAIDAQGIRSSALWLLKVTQACDRILSNSRLNGVTRISQARLLAVAIHLNEEISEQERYELLGRWEKVTFRIYGLMNYDARTKVGDYVRLAWKVGITNQNLTANEIHRELHDIGKDYPIQSAIEAMYRSNCYENWQEELRYLMFRYEEYLARKKGINFRNEHWAKIWQESASSSIEHIVPQSTAPEDIKHILGNLMILPPGLNSRLRDKKPKNKLQEYRDTGLLCASRVATMTKFTKSAIREREKELLDWAYAEWDDPLAS